MQVEDISFNKFLNNVQGKEGIVCLGAGGNPDEWLTGVTNALNEDGVVKGTPDEIWSSVVKMITTGGRTDIAFILNNNNESKYDIGKMAMWRLSFGDCSWISDYVVNYAKHFR